VIARTAWSVVAIAMLGYLAIARVLGDVYPFSTFSMYGGATLESASRIVVVAADGAAEIESFATLACDREIDVAPLACAHEWPYAHFPAVDEEAAAAIAARASPRGAGEPVAVVRRIWRFDADGLPVASDCELARCEATR
jgi:hypothetical protein